MHCSGFSYFFRNQLTFTLHLPGSIFHQISCCQVGSPREIYLQVHKEIINLTCMIFCSLSTLLFHIPSKSLQKSMRIDVHRSWEGRWHLIYVFATVIGWTILHGPTEIAQHKAWRQLSWLTHSFTDLASTTSKHHSVTLNIHRFICKNTHKLWKYCFLADQIINFI